MNESTINEKSFFIFIGKENDPKHKTVSSSIAEVHGNDGSSGSLVKNP